MILTPSQTRSHRDFRNREADIVAFHTHSLPRRAVTATSGIVRRTSRDSTRMLNCARSHRDFRNREAEMLAVVNAEVFAPAQSPRLQES